MNTERLKQLGRTAMVLGALAVLACGGGNSPTDLPPIDDGPEPEPPAPEVRGAPIYAVDLDNRLLLFGTESPGTIARMMPITGVPLLKRIVGLDFRPSNGKLYGVGNDSRVYTIDTLTGAATAVSSEPFTPGIASFFDIHFGMGFDPVTERIRLISAEGGVNWLINPDDGTAVVQGKPHYAAGDPNEGKSLSIAGLAYVPASAGAASLQTGSLSPAVRQDTWVLKAIDAQNGMLGEFIDVETGEFVGLGPIEGMETKACAEVKFDGRFLWAIIPLAGSWALVQLNPLSVGLTLVGQIGSAELSLAIQAFSIGQTLVNLGNGIHAEAGRSAMKGSALTSQAWAAPDPHTECTSIAGD